jgi:uncharacterized membrane protein YgcG
MRASRGRAVTTRLLRAVGTALVGVALILPLVAQPAAAADPPPERVEGQRIYDDALLGDALRPTAQQLVDLMAQLHGVDVIVIARHRDGTVTDPDAEATATAKATIDRWGLDNAVVLVAEAARDDCNGGIGIATAGSLPGTNLDAGQLVDPNVRSALESCNPGAAAIETLGGIVTALAGIGLPGGGGGAGGLAPGEVPAGPPFPDPEVDRAVYDQAGVLSDETIAQAESTIDAIEARTGAEVVVYTQVRDYGVTQEQADSDAQALMDQWGVGRKGFDDGLVILFDLDPSKEHGQVNLYGGPGYRAAYLDNAEKQRIFDQDMLPLLRQGDLDGALKIALQRVDAIATPEHAQRLQLARQVDAAVGLVGAPVVFLVLIGSGLFAWLRFGRDPVYLDDPSIHMAGPPRDLTPAAGTFVLHGGPSRRALTTALLDLASRGAIAFRQESELFGLKKKVGIEVEPAAADANEEARRARNSARPLGPAADLARRHLSVLAHGSGYIEPDDLAAGFAPSVAEFDEALEGEAIAGGWFREKPSKARQRWMIRGAIALFAGIGGVVAGLNIPSNGLTLIGGAALVAGIALIVMSYWMPAVSIPGSMIRAMLAAYRRTLEKTMAQSRSMDEVVQKANLSWLQTPDQAVVWGTALGLEKEIEGVLERSLDDVTSGRAAATSTYFPIWFGAGSPAQASGFAAGGGGGLFSSSGVPDIGGMMASLSTIGTPPGGSGGGGGFGGGGSGGGGGGSGGGF